MRLLTAQLNIWLPGLGVAAFSVGVFAGLAHGGIIGYSFLIALLCGAGVFMLDCYASGPVRIKQMTSSNNEPKFSGKLPQILAAKRQHHVASV